MAGSAVLTERLALVWRFTVWPFTERWAFVWPSFGLSLSAGPSPFTERLAAVFPQQNPGLPPGRTVASAIL
eukprot:1184843-Prorocentrum_minimum.AAC.1